MIKAFKHLYDFLNKHECYVEGIEIDIKFPDVTSQYRFRNILKQEADDLWHHPIHECPEGFNLFGIKVNIK